MARMKVGIITALLGCVVLCVVPILLAGEPATPDAKKAKKVNITVSRETTWITEPLNLDGTVDYIAAANKMLSKGVTKDNNAAILMIKAFGPKFFGDEDAKRYIKALDIMLPENAQYFFSQYDFAYIVFPDNEFEERQNLRDNIGAAISAMLKRPLTDAERSAATDWIKTNKVSLQLLTEAANRPRFYIPLIPKEDSCVELWDFLNFSYASKSRNAVKALCLKAILLADEGKIDDAMASMLTAKRLGGLTAQRNMLIDSLVAIATTAMADSTAGYIASHYKLTADQAKRCLAQLQKLPPLPPMIDAYSSTERLYSLSFWQSAASFGLDKATLLFAWDEEEKKVKIPHVELNWDMLLKMENEAFDKLIKAASAKTFKERHSKFRELEGNVEEIDFSQLVQKIEELGRTRSNLKKLIEEVGTDDRDKLTLAVRNLFCDNSFVLPSRLFSQDAKQRVAGSLTEVAFAIAAYKAEKGKYPQKLADLAPDYIKAVPNDIFSDKPLIYKLTDDGYVLYSVGQNMKDDGGKSDSDNKEDDILISTAVETAEEESD